MPLRWVSSGCLAARRAGWLIEAVNHVGSASEGFLGVGSSLAHPQGSC